MIILGIDPGLAIVGYGVISVERGNSSVVDYGVINTPKELKICASLAEFRREMQKKVDMQKDVNI